jgi:hypothetical protein
VIAGVRADVEHDVVAAHEAAVEMTQPPLAKWNRVVDRDRSCEADAVEHAIT